MTFHTRCPRTLSFLFIGAVACAAFSFILPGSGFALAADSTDALLEQLKSSKKGERLEAIRHLEKPDDARIISALIKALDDSDDQVAQHAAVALTKCDDARVRTAFRKALIDNAKPRVREHMASHLAREPTPEDLEALVRATKDESHVVRHSALYGLGKLRNPRTIDLLIASVDDKHASVAREALQALAKFDDPRARKQVLRGLSANAHVEARVWAIQYFTQNPLPEATAVIIKAIDDKNDRMATSAVEALTKIADPRARSALLRSVTENTNSHVRQRAIQHLSQHADDDAREPLIQATKDENAGIRQLAVSALGKHRHPSVLSPLLAALNDKTPHVVAAATQSLSGRTELQAKAALVRVLVDSKNTRARLVAATHFTSHPYPPAVDALGRALDARDASLRHVAVRALVRHRDESTARPRVIAALCNRSNETHLAFLRGGGGRGVIREPRVEMIGGEILYGEVTAYSAPAKGVTEGSLQIAVSHGTAASSQVRINPRWLRRIAMHDDELRPYKPGNAWLDHGESLHFRRLKWSPTGVRLLADRDIRDISWDDLVELHMPTYDRWKAYVEQLAASGAALPANLMYVKTNRGEQLVCPANRFRPFTEIESDERTWSHHVQPIWCRDPIRILHGEVILLVQRPPTRLPIVWRHWIPANRKTRQAGNYYHAQYGANVLGEPLISGNRAGSWGIGMMATDKLVLQLPDFVHGFQATVGLDAKAGQGGCARALVRVDDASGDKTLYASPLLIGSTRSHQTGVVDVPPDAMTLHVVADPAHRERPSGADPLNIRDFVDWLEPELLLDLTVLMRSVSSVKTGTANKR